MGRGSQSTAEESVSTGSLGARTPKVEAIEQVSGLAERVEVSHAVVSVRERAVPERVEVRAQHDPVVTQRASRDARRHGRHTKCRVRRVAPSCVRTRRLRMSRMTTTADRGSPDRIFRVAGDHRTMHATARSLKGR